MHDHPPRNGSCSASRFLLESTFLLPCSFECYLTLFFSFTLCYLPLHWSDLHLIISTLTDVCLLDLHHTSNLWEFSVQEVCGTYTRYHQPFYPPCIYGAQVCLNHPSKWASFGEKRLNFRPMFFVYRRLTSQFLIPLSFITNVPPHLSGLSSNKAEMSHHCHKRLSSFYPRSNPG